MKYRLCMVWALPKRTFQPDISCEYSFLRATIKGVTFPVIFTAGLRVAVKWEDIAKFRFRKYNARTVLSLERTSLCWLKRQHQVYVVRDITSSSPSLHSMLLSAPLCSIWYQFSVFPGYPKIYWVEFCVKLNQKVRPNDTISVMYTLHNIYIIFNT